MDQFTPADGDDVAQYMERLRSELRRGADGAMDGTHVCTFCQEGVTPPEPRPFCFLLTQVLKGEDSFGKNRINVATECGNDM